MFSEKPSKMCQKTYWNLALMLRKRHAFGSLSSSSLLHNSHSCSHCMFSFSLLPWLAFWQSFWFSGFLLSLGYWYAGVQTLWGSLQRNSCGCSEVQKNHIWQLWWRKLIHFQIWTHFFTPVVRHKVGHGILAAGLMCIDLIGDKLFISFILFLPHSV